MSSTKNDALSAIDRNRILRVGEAAKLRGVSPDSVRRHLKDKAIKLGPRSTGYRLCDVLALTNRAIP
jgi:predicted DNA-binding transcriptional regulator AlpA